jgi:hypothetical protein
MVTVPAHPGADSLPILEARQLPAAFDGCDGEMDLAGASRNGGCVGYD